MLGLLSDKAVKQADDGIHLDPEATARLLPRFPGRCERCWPGLSPRGASGRGALDVERDRQAKALRGDLIDRRDLREALLVGERLVRRRDALLVLGL